MHSAVDQKRDRDQESDEPKMATHTRILRAAEVLATLTLAP